MRMSPETIAELEYVDFVYGMLNDAAVPNAKLNAHILHAANGLLLETVEWLEAVSSKSHEEREEASDIMFFLTLLERELGSGGITGDTSGDFDLQAQTIKILDTVTKYVFQNRENKLNELISLVVTFRATFAQIAKMNGYPIGELREINTAKLIKRHKGRAFNQSVSNARDTQGVN